MSTEASHKRSVKIKDLCFEVKIIDLLPKILINGNWTEPDELIPYLEKIGRGDVIDELARFGISFMRAD